MQPNGFWSYASSDDKNSSGRVSLIRRQLASELRLNIGPKHNPEIFQDSVSIPLGEEWETKIRQALATCSFIVPIISPAFLQSEWCCRELMLFREREKQLGRADLIFPIFFIDIDHVDARQKHDCFDPDVLALLKQRQYVDYRGLRLKSATGQSALLKIESLARAIRGATRKAAPDSGREPPAPPAMPAPDADTKIETLLDVAEQSGAFERAGEQGISERAVREIVEKLGGRDVEKDDLLKWLDEWIEAARRGLGRSTNEGVAFDIAREEAERRFKGGLGGASAALMDELDREQNDSRRKQLRILEEALRFDELSLDVEAAVEKLQRMAIVDGKGTPIEIGKFLMVKALEYYERGDQKGENAALSISIAVYRAVLEKWARERVPLQWAMTQNNLGNALRTLGARERGTARLEEAIAAFSSALEECTRERVPLDWAATQNNLGIALRRLGERESSTTRLEGAITAYRAALEEWTRERVPLDWAMAQNNLGVALSTLGERDSGTAHFEEAVIAYKAALQERTRERVPLSWAMTQNNLGVALNTIGEREGGTARLEESVLAYRAALEEQTRERLPLGWAMTQNNLGNALSTLGERENGTGRLEEAVEAYSEALKEYTRDQVPLDWAGSTGNQGIAMMLIAGRKDDLQLARRARDQIDAAYQTLRDIGHSPFATYCESKLEEARALCRRLQTMP